MLTQPLDKFCTTAGIEYQRYADFRDAVKPSWRNLYKPNFTPSVHPKPARTLVQRAVNLVTSHGGSIRKVLEVGCYGGANSFALAEVGAQLIDALDITPLSELVNLRNHTSNIFDKTNCEITFHSSDIADWNEEEKYTLVASWQTLEHIIRWRETLKKMYSALKPGGLCYHIYEPFFSWRGGHSSCTLDFPYGHVLLSSEDFDRYIQQYRPDEYNRTMNSYHTGLNRMTLAKLHNCVKEVGFEEIVIVVETLEGQQWATPTMVRNCQVNYPSLTVRDLTAHSVRVLLRRGK